MAKVKLRAASKSQCRGRSGGSCSCGRCPGGEAGEPIYQSYSVHPRRVKSDRLLVKGTAGRAGLDPGRYSGHSLRAGLATAAGDTGASLPDLMRQTRHKSTEVALGYLRPADLWRNNVTETVFGTKAAGKG